MLGNADGAFRGIYVARVVYASVLATLTLKPSYDYSKISAATILALHKSLIHPRVGY